MPQIHPTAIVHPQAELGKDVEIGPYSMVEADVIIGDNCQIHSHVHVNSGARLGKNVRVFKGAAVAGDPQDLKFKSEKTTLEVGDGTTIREFSTLNRGTDFYYKTVIGKNCLFMAYAHVAHDCIIGDHCIIANAVNIGGHVEIGDHATIGGMTPVHQFVRIGAYSFVGGGYRAVKDVPPYVLALGEPLHFGGVNFIGLSRKGFSEETIAAIKRAYKVIFRSKLAKKEALQKLRDEFEPLPELETIIRFMEQSERGLIKG